MVRQLIAAATSLVAACTPTLNWREVSIEPAGLKATLPCKPDQARRRAEFMPGREIVLHASGCEAGGGTFAVLHAELASPAEAGATLAQWKAASLATLRSRASTEAVFQPPGALGVRESVKVNAQGTRADGRAVESQAAYFARGARVFQAVIYADRIREDMSEPFFAGLRFE